MDPFQPPHVYMRPPPAPPSMVADPWFPRQHHNHPPPPPPLGTWFSGQFQYHPFTPPPHQLNQWGPSPNPNPYHAPPRPNSSYCAPLYSPPRAPPPRHPSHPQVNQDWGNANWTHHSSWEYRAPSHVAPWISYPPITPAFPSARQHYPSVGTPRLSGQPTPIFGRGPSFHPTAAFPVDVYGAFLGSERPRKAAVPNWLIKNKATITSSVPKHFKKGTKLIKDESIDESTGSCDQADSNSMDSSRSTEEEDDSSGSTEEEDDSSGSTEEEDDSSRSTEEEDDSSGSTEDDDDDWDPELWTVIVQMILDDIEWSLNRELTDSSSDDDRTDDDMAWPYIRIQNHKLSLPPPPVVVPVKAKGCETENASRREASSRSLGNVLGVANYASDYETSNVPKSDNNACENGHPDVPKERLSPRKSTKDDFQERDARRLDRHKSKRSPSGRDITKVIVSSEEREDEDESHGRRDERHKKKRKTEDYNNSSNDSLKEQGGKHGEEKREYDSRKRSPRREVKDSKKEREIDEKTSVSDYKAPDNSLRPEGVKKAKKKGNEQLSEEPPRGNGVADKLGSLRTTISNKLKLDQDKIVASGPDNLDSLELKAYHKLAKELGLDDEED